MHQTFSAVFIGAVLVAAQSTAALAQTAAPSQPGSVTLPTVTVTAQKEPTDIQRIPVSVTAVPADWLTFGSTISDAGIFAPNAYFSEFTARKLTNPRFRGIGASPANPSI